MGEGEKKNWWCVEDGSDVASVGEEGALQVDVGEETGLLGGGKGEQIMCGREERNVDGVRKERELQLAEGRRRERSGLGEHGKLRWYGRGVGS